MGFSAKTQVTLPFVSNLWDLKPAVAAPPPGPKPTLVLVVRKWQEHFLPEMYSRKEVTDVFFLLVSGCRFYNRMFCKEKFFFCTRGYKWDMLRCTPMMVSWQTYKYQQQTSVYHNPKWDMYDILTYMVPQKSTIHVGKYTSPMDSMRIGMLFQPS